jgi:hypothetical protein
VRLPHRVATTEAILEALAPSLTGAPDSVAFAGLCDTAGWTQEQSEPFRKKLFHGRRDPYSEINLFFLPFTREQISE